MTQQEAEIIPSRITVLDSGELDNEIHSITNKQLNNILNLLPKEITYFEPELQTCLKIIMWLLSVDQSYATFGQQLLNIKYSKDSSSRRLGTLGIFQIGTSYLKLRMTTFFSFTSNQALTDMGYKIIERAELIANIIGVLYFTKFLRQGGAPTFLEYLFGLKPISTAPPSSRNIGYSFMTRELIWYGLIELLVLLIPMINYHALKRRFNKIIFGNFGKKEATTQVELTRENMNCAICRNFLIVPHHMGCSHLFCYYCIMSHRIADKKFECPKCSYSNPEGSVIPLSLKW